MESPVVVAVVVGQDRNYSCKVADAFCFLVCVAVEVLD